MKRRSGGSFSGHTFSWAGDGNSSDFSLQIAQIHKLLPLQLNMSLKASFLYVFLFDERLKTPRKSWSNLINFERL